MAQDTLATGSTTSSMAKERKAGTMERLCTRGISSRAKSMAREGSHGRMAPSMMEILLMASSKAKVNYFKLKAL